jgi:NADPH:quinone reductase-like Zn-dependent oxidoreductase
MQRTSTLDDGLSVSAAPQTGALAVKEGPAHFEPVADLCVTGEVRIHIDRTFTLEELPAVLARVGEGRALGKVVVCPS